MSKKKQDEKASMKILSDKSVLPHKKECTRILEISIDSPTLNNTK